MPASHWEFQGKPLRSEEDSETCEFGGCPTSLASQPLRIDGFSADRVLQEGDVAGATLLEAGQLPAFQPS